MTILLHSLPFAFLLAFAAEPAQEPAPLPPPVDVARPAEEPAALPEPGVLPADASLDARELWEALVARNLGKEPIRAFDLSFWMRHRSQDGRQQNDTDARFRFLMPGFARVQLESGREHVRGPRGDFLVDGEEVLSLTARTHVEDRRQLDETVAIARNFLSVADPARLRIVRLARAATPPFGLPETMQERASALVWLEVTSPDFHLARRADNGSNERSSNERRDARRQPALYRASLGLDPKDHRIVFAVIQEEIANAPTLSPSTMFVELSAHRDLDGFRIPHSVHVHEVDLNRSPWAFRPRATSELRLKPKPDTIGLRPTLTAEDFVP